MKLIDQGLLHAHLALAADIRREFILGLAFQRNLQELSPLNLRCHGLNLYLGWVTIHVGIYFPELPTKGE